MTESKNNSITELIFPGLIVKMVRWRFLALNKYCALSGKQNCYEGLSDTLSWYKFKFKCKMSSLKSVLIPLKLAKIHLLCILQNSSRSPPKKESSLKPVNNNLLSAFISPPTRPPRRSFVVANLYCCTVAQKSLFLLIFNHN